MIILVTKYHRIQNIQIQKLQAQVSFLPSQSHVVDCLTSLLQNSNIH